jgi:3-isopropylmalate dehydrogenase
MPHFFFADKAILFHSNITETKMARFNIALSLFLAASTSAFVAPGRQFASKASPLQAVSKKDSYSVTLLPGDGIGPEITAATKVALAALCEKCGFEIELKEALIGGAAIDAVNDPFPQESLDQCLASDSVLLACIGGYKWDNNPRELRPESGLLKMRKEMGLFANLRPAKVLPQLINASTLKPEIVEGVDIMCVRELTGDVYFGTPKGIDVINGKWVNVGGNYHHDFVAKDTNPFFFRRTRRLQ